MPESEIFLRDFRAVLPKNRGTQASILDWLAEAHARAELSARPLDSGAEGEAVTRKIKKLVLRFGCSTDRVRFRNSALDDFLHTDWAKMRIFKLDQCPSGAPASERSRFYSEVVEEAFRKFYAEETIPPSVLLHVTCTGYVSPSGAQRLIAERRWGESTEVLHAYHMGCYAALPAIRIAAGQLERGKAKVDVVHTELCTLHLNPAERAPEQIVMQTLFADGMIRYSLSSEPGGLELVATREEIIPESETEMTWMASDHGMRMTLSRDVPGRIGKVLHAFLERLLAGTGVGYERALFAVHPGGPRIIDQVQRLLELRDEQVAASNHILGEHGNMSSATLPHIWQCLLEDPCVARGTWIISLAFGPGLTISGALLRKRAGSHRAGESDEPAPRTQ